MGAGTGDRDAGFAQVVTGTLRDVLEMHRLEGWQRAQEQCARRALGAGVAQIVHDRLADDRRQGEGGVMPCLAFGDLQPLTLPIDRVEGEGCDLCGTQTVGHEQKKDREVAFADRGSPVDDFSEQALHIFPRDRARNVRKSIDARTLDTGAEINRQHPFPVQVAQEHAHVTTQPAHRAFGEFAAGNRW